MKFSLWRLLVLCLVVACAKHAVRPCDATTCSGCCDEHEVCRSGVEATACGVQGAVCAVCAETESCDVVGQCHSVDGGDARDASVDASVDGGVDSGFDGGDAGFDAGLDGGADSGADGGCGGGLFGNGNFECGLAGWTVLDGTGGLVDGGVDGGGSSLLVVADSLGLARAGLSSPLAFNHTATLCVSFSVKGTVPVVQAEVLVSPSSNATTFSAPVTLAWSRVPPAPFSVPVPTSSQVWVTFRAVNATAGEVLQLDGLVLSEGVNAVCP